ncbi:MAG: CBS domain-containing protein [Chloroflexi bacterium]|nr:CBS domain-containing protein [Chloroflexota bacterium]
MTAANRRSTACPSCGTENIPGSDICQGCQSDLARLDLPETFQPASDSDLLRPLAEARLSKPVSIGAGATVREAVALLASDPNGAVVVVEDGAIVGILTERDVLKSIAGREGLMASAVRDVMTPDPVFLREDDTMAVALNKMSSGGFRHIPLVRDGELVALVTATDVMNWVMGCFFD